MDGFEFNKIFAAVLLAGLVAMLSGFVAEKVVKPEIPAERAFAVEIPEAGAGGVVAAVAAGPEPISGLLAAADPAAGEKLVKACVACHSFDKGGANKVGPNLWSIVGADHAHMEGFAYSKSMAALKGTKWDYEALNNFLYNPKKAIPGTKMVFAGLKKTQDRANIIAWLRLQSDSPVAIPPAAIPAAATPAAAPAEAAPEAAPAAAPPAAH